MYKKLKLNIQMFAKLKEDENTPKEMTPEEVANLVIDLDTERKLKEQAIKEKEEFEKKYNDEHKANLRLMTRISEKQNSEEEEKEKEVIKPAKITDLYNYKSGKLELKK